MPCKEGESQQYKATSRDKGSIKQNKTKQLPLHLNTVRKKTEKKQWTGRSIKIRAEINEKEMKETIANFNTTKSSFSQKISKIYQPLGRFIKKEWEKN